MKRNTEIPCQIVRSLKRTLSRDFVSSDIPSMYGRNLRNYRRHGVQRSKGYRRHMVSLKMKTLCPLFQWQTIYHRSGFRFVFCDDLLKNKPIACLFVTVQGIAMPTRNPIRFFVHFVSKASLKFFFEISIKFRIFFIPIWRRKNVGPYLETLVWALKTHFRKRRHEKYTFPILWTSNFFCQSKLLEIETKISTPPTVQ
jgi:hypothetical protein